MTSYSRIRFWIIYFFVTGIIIFLFLELTVRFLKLAPPFLLEQSKFVSNKYLPNQPIPFSKIRGKPKSVLFDIITRESAFFEYDVEYEHNSLGFRDIEHAFSKPKNTFRILGLGDSFTYGQGVSFQDSYLYKLEEKLNSRNGKSPQIEIIKAGFRGYFPEPERLVFEHYGIKFQPDLILVSFLPNDVIDTFFGIDAIRIGETGYLLTYQGRRIEKLGVWLFRYSHVCRIVLPKLLSYVNNRAVSWPDVYKPNGKHEESWKKIEYEYKKMIDLADNIKAKIVFVHIPQIGPWNDSASYPALRLSKWCEEQGIDFIDTLPSIKRASRDKVLYWKGDRHCNSEGYKIIAETLYAKLIEKNLVP